MITLLFRMLPVVFAVDLGGVALAVAGHHSYLRARTGLSRAAWKEG